MYFKVPAVFTGVAVTEAHGPLTEVLETSTQFGKEADVVTTTCATLRVALSGGKTIPVNSMSRPRSLLSGAA